MSGDVLSGAAAGALASDLFVARLLVSSKLAFRVGVEIRPLTRKNKGHQQLGVQSWRRHVILQEELIRGINGLFELHVRETLPQRTQRTQNTGAVHHRDTGADWSG